MIFSLAVYSSPSSTISYSAWQFAKSIQNSEHQLYRVFFYLEGVYNANQLMTPPTDELNMAKLWKELNAEKSTDLCVCVAAGIRRGVVDKAEAARHNLNAFNLAEGFEIVGLGQLLDASVKSDRLVTFG